jgi:hypothetical protein
MQVFFHKVKSRGSVKVKIDFSYISEEGSDRTGVLETKTENFHIAQWYPLACV